MRPISIRLAVIGLAILMICGLLRRGFSADSTAPLPTSRPTLPAMRLTRIDGQPLGVGRAATRPTALVFLGTQCPISRWYVPALNQLSTAAQAAGVDLVGVISDPTVSRSDALQFSTDFQAAFPIVFDASGELANALHPLATPQVILVDRAGQVLYSGRIDDAWSAVGRKAQHVDHHELADAIAAIGRGAAVNLADTAPVGCTFESWDAPHGGPASVTYARDIAPILAANCVGCHHDGSVAPFSLTSFADAAKRSKQIAAVTDSRLMPPWKAAADFGRFVDERRLSDAQIALLAKWSEAGAPLGNPADLPPPQTFPDGWMLGKPDIVLAMPSPFAVPAGGADIYRAFDLPVDLPEDTYISAVEFRPGARTVVHHSLFFLDNTGEARKRTAANTDGQPGYTSFGGIGFLPSGGLGGWAPGATAYRLPDGTGRLLKKNSDVVLQVHYHPDGRPHQDQCQLALYLAKTPVTRRIISFPLGTRQIDIPAGDKQYVREIHITAPLPITLTGVTPHMHLLGREMKVTATRPDGQVIPLIWINDWDFRWQDQYRYVEPIHLPVGTRIDMKVTYDNSDDNPANPSSPPRRVTYGEQTTDEMCLCFLQMEIDARGSADTPLARLRQALRGQNNNNP